MGSHTLDSPTVLSAYNTVETNENCTTPPEAQLVVQYVLENSWSGPTCTLRSYCRFCDTHVVFCFVVAKLRQTYFIAAPADLTSKMESLTVNSNCSLHTGEVELKSEELATADATHLERVDSVESFQTGTSTETFETVRLD